MFFNFLTFKSSYSVPHDVLYMDNFFFFLKSSLFTNEKIRHTEVEYSSKNTQLGRSGELRRVLGTS